MTTPLQPIKTIFTCIEYTPNNDTYTIQDSSSTKFSLYTNRIKELLHDKDTVVTNIKLNKNGDITIITEPNNEIDKLLLKAKILGLPVVDLYTAFNNPSTYNLNKVYLIKKNQTDSILLIKNNLAILSSLISYLYQPNTNYYRLLGKNLTVIGGEGLLNASQLFTGLLLDKLDITLFNTNNVQLMVSMFNKSTIHKLILPRPFITSNVYTMENMFTYFNTNTLDITGIDTSNVIHINNMFKGAEIENLTIGQLDLRKVTTFTSVLSDIKSENLKIDPSTWRYHPDRQNDWKYWLY